MTRAGCGELPRRAQEQSLSERGAWDGPGNTLQRDLVWESVAKQQEEMGERFRPTQAWTGHSWVKAGAFASALSLPRTPGGQR